MKYDGVIIKTEGTLDYYKGPFETTRATLKKPNGHRVQTVKTESDVTVMNKYIAVTVKADGTIVIEKHEQVED